MTVTRPNLLIGRDFVKAGYLTVSPLKTTDRLPINVQGLVGYPQKRSVTTIYAYHLHRQSAVAPDHHFHHFSLFCIVSS